jgi:hypothetical protein
MEASLLRIARVSPAQHSRGLLFFVRRRRDDGDKAHRIGLSRCDISTRSSLSLECSISN